MAASNRRLVVSALVGVVVGAIASFVAPWQVAVLLGWCAAAVGFLAEVYVTVSRLDASATKDIALREDPGRLLADGVLLLAAIASLIGVGFVLAKAGESSGWTKGATAALGTLSVAMSWTTVQTLFALRYAHLYYTGEDEGIDFKSQGVEQPDYLDFAYTAFTVGMTFQVSDTDITRRTIRRTVLRHALLSFLFGAVIVASAVNIVATLLN